MSEQTREPTAVSTPAPRRIGFVLGDPRLPFPAAACAGRWHVAGGPPLLHVADTPDGAWAELLRHEEISDPADLAGIRRRLWAVELELDGEVQSIAEGVGGRVATGDEWSYAACREVAGRTFDAGVTVLRVRSAALQPTGDSTIDTSFGTVWVLAGERRITAWITADAGAPAEAVLRRVAPLGQGGGRPGDGPERRRRERRQTIDLVRLERGEPERRAGFLGDRRGSEDDAPEAPDETDAGAIDPQE